VGWWGSESGVRLYLARAAALSPYDLGGPPVLLLLFTLP
jgi:hypothetical protein